MNLALEDGVLEAVRGRALGAVRDDLTLRLVPLGWSQGMKPVNGSSPDHAARGIERLLASLAAHDDVLDRNGASGRVSAGGNLAAALGGFHLLGGAAEAVAPYGGAAVEHLVAAAGDAVEGRMLEVEDLYDTGRSARRCAEVAWLRTGSVLSAAACLGALAAGADEGVVTALDVYGHELGVALEIGHGCRALQAEGGSPRGPGSGVYALPVVLAIEEDGSLAELLGGALDEEAHAELVSRITRSNAIPRSRDECSRRVTAARLAIQDLPDPNGLASVAREVAAEAVGGGQR